MSISTFGMYSDCKMSNSCHYCLKSLAIRSNVQHAYNCGPNKTNAQQQISLGESKSQIFYFIFIFFVNFFQTTDERSLSRSRIEQNNRHQGNVSLLPLGLSGDIRDMVEDCRTKPTLAKTGKF